jgi:hypothetical protein
MNSLKEVPIYITLLDEGSPTMRPTTAIALGNGLYRMMSIPNYDSEDEAWKFLPGSTVRLKEITLPDGKTSWIAVHQDPSVISIWVRSSEKPAPPQRETYALPLGDDLYKILPTPHYTSEQLWEFPPGSVVRLKEMPTAYKGQTYLLAVAP